MTALALDSELKCGKIFVALDNQLSPHRRPTMQDCHGITATPHENHRDSERNRGIWFMMPGTVFMFPLFYFVATSVYTGKDQFGPLRDFLSKYEVVVLIAMVPVIASLLYSLYLIVIKDIIDNIREERTERILRRFAPMYQRRMSAGEIIAAVCFFGLMAFYLGGIVYLYFFH